MKFLKQLKQRIRKNILSNPKRGVHLKYIFRANKAHCDDDSIVRIHGWHLKSLVRHQVVEVTNLDNMRSFKVKVAGAGDGYKMRSNKAIVLTYNQRAKLGLSKDDREGNLVLNEALGDDELKLKELRLTQYALGLAFVSFVIGYVV